MMLRSLLLQINFSFEFETKAKKVSNLFCTVSVNFILPLQNQFPAMEKMDVPWRTHQPPCPLAALTLARVPHTGR